MKSPIVSHQRQVHLDFHTSPFIGDAGSEFDAVEFAETLQRAKVNSVTIFAKCHHGMCYYPTKTGTMHPALRGRDLLGEQIEALHQRGIRCPIYTTVGWEEEAAHHHPEWRQMKLDGTFAVRDNPDHNAKPQPGKWKYLNFIHPGYQDYLEAHVGELIERYGKSVDGFFFDIVFFDKDACWSPESRKFRQRHGLLADDLETQTRFSTLAQTSFSRRFTRFISGRSAQATIFYNSPNPIYADATQGVRSRHALQTHWELESLPSGFWGYQHFPRLARAFRAWGKPWLGMTGRFQKMWGDFGGLKPQAALEYECFRTQALGGANSIGDQLPPRGILDAGAYDLIGAVYAQCEGAEPFYRGSEACPVVGIVAPGSPKIPALESDKSLEGAVQMCDELHYESVVLDDQSEWDGLKLLVLPDSVEVTTSLAKRLRDFVTKGGKLIVSGSSGFDENGRSLISSLDVRIGARQDGPTYWRTRADFSPALSRSERVVYSDGCTIVRAPRAKVLVDRVLPYFRRTDLAFCSHFQSPPQKDAAPSPAVVATRRVIYFADPIFREYRQSGNTAVRDGWKLAMLKLMGPSDIGRDLPTTMLCVPRRRGRDLCITLLHYIPTRKSLEIDMIEEASSFAGEILKVPTFVDTIRIFPTGDALEKIAPGEFTLPITKGRLLLEIPGYFAKRT